MNWSNYHGHSHYCDGKGELEDYVKAALEIGMKTMGFSTHAPLPFKCLWTMNKEDLPTYRAEITRLQEKYKGQIQLYASLEVDYIPEVMSPDHKIIKQLNLDYTIGSVHFIDNFPDGTPFEADGSRQIFVDAIDQIFSGDEKKLVRRYYALMREMLTDTNPTILGHLDKIKIHNSPEMLFDENAPWYRDEVMQVLEILADRNIIMEINTRGIYKKKCDATYPSAWIVKEAKKKNIRVTINSDAHHPREITVCFDIAADMLREVGYRETFRLWNGDWEAIAL